MSNKKNKKSSVATYPVQTIASLLLISERRVQQLTKEGFLSKNDRGKYHLAPSIQGYIRYLNNRLPSNEATSSGVRYYEEKARKVKAEADLAEMEVQKRSSELLPADEVKREWAILATEVRIRMRNIPSRVVSTIAGETNERVIKELLITEIDSELTAIADGDPIDEIEE